MLPRRRTRRSARRSGPSSILAVSSRHQTTPPRRASASYPVDERLPFSGQLLAQQNLARPGRGLSRFSRAGITLVALTTSASPGEIVEDVVKMPCPARRFAGDDQHSAPGARSIGVCAIIPPEAYKKSHSSSVDQLQRPSQIFDVSSSAQCPGAFLNLRRHSRRISLFWSAATATDFGSRNGRTGTARSGADGSGEKRYRAGNASFVRR